MKKIWKIRKDTKAVSPVIATILMVAITVVLAAVLYVMVMGFGGGETQTPTGSFTSTTKINSTAEKVVFGIITPDVRFDECKLVLEHDGSIDTVDWTTETPTNNITADSVGVKAVDLADDDKISNGDYIIISGATSAMRGSWTVTLIYAATGDQICTTSFTF